MVSLTTCNFILHSRQNEKGEDGLSNNMQFHHLTLWSLLHKTYRKVVKMVSLTTCLLLTTCNFILHSRQNEKGKDGLSNNMQFHLTLSTKRER